MPFELFLFDLDGTLVDTEEYHSRAYQLTLTHFFDESITQDEYVELCNSSNKIIQLVEQLNTKYNKHIAWDMFYRYKEQTYINFIETSVKLVPGAENFLTELAFKSKKIVLVTHSPLSVVEILQAKFPILKCFDLIISKDSVKYHKPHPEGYLKALSAYPGLQAIGFEDSIKGWGALTSCPVRAVSVGKLISSEYNIPNFEGITLDVINKIPYYQNFEVKDWVSLYQQSIATADFEYNLHTLVPLLTRCKSNIFITGIGKCGHVAKKCVSTWQSLNISCHYVNIPDLFHGDFGIFKPGDTIIYISNSGNTIEMLNAAKHIRDNFSLYQIAVTFNPLSLIQKLVDFHLVLHEKVSEIGSLSVAPTVSSVLFMMFIDMVGVRLAELNNITLTTFKICHPGGDLGKSKTKTLNIFVIASGFGTRMYPLTKYIPKILVNFRGKTFAEHLVDYWSKYGQVTFVVHSSYVALVQEYVGLCNVLAFDKAVGTAETIQQIVPKELYGQNILFTWCDILPTHSIDFSKITNATVFTCGTESRYLLRDKKITKVDSGGNIIGLYYIPTFTGLSKYTVGEDLCDVLTKQEVDQYDIECIDVGDLPKYRSLVEYSQYKTRFFNKITDLGDKLLKEATCEQGNQIIAREIHWYFKVGIKSYLPTIYSTEKSSFTMRKLPAQKVDNPNEYIPQLIDILSDLHNTKGEYSYADLEYEVKTKTLQRCKEIASVIKHFGSVTRVNGVDISRLNLEDIVESCWKILSTLDPKEGCLIHGDCQFSNIVLADRLYLIDPRGYFGKTLLFGPKEYDYAKVMYALTGYDYFNNHTEFSIDLTDEELSFPTKTYELDNPIFTDKVKAWIPIIWLSLAQYSRDNPLKVVAAYYNGFAWFKKLELCS